jgi:CubicO group peptidase (beta-lactamase class C family)
MSTPYESLAGKYLSFTDDDNAQPPCWEHKVDLDIWFESSVTGSGQWLVRFNDRVHLEPLVGSLALSKRESGQVKFEVPRGFPNWMVRGTINVEGEIYFEDGEDVRLKLRQYHQGMTGLETWAADLRKVTGVVDVNGSKEENSSSKYDHLVERILRDYSAPNELPLQPHIDAMILIKDGETLFEHYFGGMTPATTHMISSCTKSITSLLAGVALGQGLFSLDDRVMDHFPDISSKWGEEPPILVRHVLSMTTGTEHTEEDSGTLLETTDVEQLVLGAKRLGNPGTIYHYDNGLPCLVGSLIERRSGMPLDEFAEKHLFGPLGIKDCVWTRMRKPSRKGVTDSPLMSSGGMVMSLRSFVKIGQMLLHNGVQDGRQVIPESYISTATARHTPSSDYPYGLYFHLNELGKVGKGPRKGEHVDEVDGYFALGQGQQVLFVAPEAGLVIAAFSSSWHRKYVGTPAPWPIYSCLNDLIATTLG